MTINRVDPAEQLSETPLERRERETREKAKAVADYAAKARQTDMRTAELRALREKKAREREAGDGKRLKPKRTGQEIADKAGLFSAGKPVKRRVGI